MMMTSRILLRNLRRHLKTTTTTTTTKTTTKVMTMTTTMTKTMTKTMMTMTGKKNKSVIIASSSSLLFSTIKNDNNDNDNNNNNNNHNNNVSMTRTNTQTRTIQSLSSSSSFSFQPISSSMKNNYILPQQQQQQQQQPNLLNHHHHHHHQHQHQQHRSLHLTPREIDHLQLYNVGKLAQNRLARGIKLNYPESVALITMQMLEYIREGTYTVSELMVLGQKLLGRNNVMDGIPDLIGNVQVEGTFPDGTKLLTVHSPISSLNGDLKEALKGSFLPIPDPSLFGNPDDVSSSTVTTTTTTPTTPPTTPGAIIPNENNESIILNPNRNYIELSVINTGDRPIQVGSHYSFIESNRFLVFNRKLSIGKRLNIPSGSSVRFEPGEKKTVTLVDIAGNCNVVSGNGITNGSTTIQEEEESCRHDEIMKRVIDFGFGHSPESSSQPGKAYVMDRCTYSDMYGPTIGDCVILGDTSLKIRVEKDYTSPNNSYGDECKFGGGKTLREGMGQATSVYSNDALDVVITNALIIDALQGIVKADVGIKGNRIVGIGKAGNPDIMSNVSPNLIVGTTTEVIAGEKLILTAGGIDTHIHFICPQQIYDAVSSGITTMYGGGTGPSAGTCATTCTPSPNQIQMMLQSTDCFPLNFGFSGKGNTSDSSVLLDVLNAGAAGFKLHEDWGTTPSAIDNALNFAEEHDVAITIHTDTLNESGFVQDSIDAMKGRTIHTYHTEGAGGGHAPDIIKIVGEDYVLPSSTNPTRPFTVNTIDEHLDMLMVCHHLDPSIPEDVAFAESRIRSETIAAEDILHDMGAMSIISSDSQAMGRVGEVISRTWQTADKMKRQFGYLNEEEEDSSNNEDDNFRVKRYIAKYTINPAIAHGMSNLIGSITPGKYADLCLWKPSLFGCKPEMIIKGGMISYSQMGDPNASIPTPQPVLMRPMFGSFGNENVGNNSIAFVSKASIEKEHDNIKDKYALKKNVVAVEKCRNLTKQDMVYNDVTPNIKVDPETFEVVVTNKDDGTERLLTCDPVDKVPLAQRFFLF